MLQTDRLNPLPKRSIARRLLIGAVIWSVVVLIGGAIVLSAVFRAQNEQLARQSLETTLVELSRALENVEVEEDGELIRDGRVATRDELFPSAQAYEIPLSGRYWAVQAVDEAGNPTAAVRSPSIWDGEVPIDPEIWETVLANPGTTYFGAAVGPNDDNLRVGMRSVLFENRETPVVLIAANDRAPTEAASQRFLFYTIGAFTFLAGGVLIAMWLQVRVGLAPLRRMVGDLSDIREGKRQKLGEDYPSEVEPLTSELNALLDHNREVVGRAQTHVGNLAHALKTPIAVLMNEAKDDSQLADVVRRQAKSMSDNVQHYLKRAQAAARAEVLGARCDIAPVVSDLARLLTRLYSEKGIEIETAVDEAVVFRGERQDLEELLGNLMENACKWAESKVRVSARIEGDRLDLSVEDDGPGLTPEQREVALKRGGRLDEQTPGTGLGLSIVGELVELHSGQFELLESDLGGLCARMRFATG